MKKTHKLKRDMLSTTAACVFGMSAGAALAQSDADIATSTDQAEDQIIVTGSFIRRDGANSPSPLAVVDRTFFEDTGVANPVDFVKFLSINTGSEFNADIFAFGSSAGTAQYNLRGLGLGSTLVLLNGRRQVLSGAAANNSITFVDINALMPQIMIDRVEILKDGASSLYGSDAVAGVVNHITRDRFEGAEVRFDYRNGQGNQETYQVDAIYGWGNDATNVVLGFSYVDQGRLLASERPFASATSSLGFPGTFFPQNAAGNNIGGPRADTLCGVGDIGGTPSTSAGGPGLCVFDLSPFTDLVSEDERILAMATIRHEVAPGHEFYADLNFSHRETLRSGAPSFPGLRPITVPLDHPRIGDAPDFGLTSPPLGQLRFFGRPLGFGLDPVLSVLSDDYYRGAFGVRGDLPSNWTYDLSLTVAHNSHLNSSRSDLLADELQAAIDSGAFNPFGTALNGVAPNSQDVIDGFRANFDTNVDSTMFVVDSVVSGDVLELPAGPLGLALGFQYRDNSREFDPNDLANNNRFFFLIGAPDSEGNQSAYSFFAETSVPVADWIELQAALRFEDYGGAIGSSVDPKVALLVQPSDFISLRASFSTAFRAPQIPQLTQESFRLGGVFDPLNPAGAGVIFAPVRTVGNPDLDAEEANTYNAGFTFRPLEGLTFNFDYWRFEYSDLITAESAQQVILADPNGPGVTRAGGVLQEVVVNLVNAPSLETDGFDMSAQFEATVPGADVDITLLTDWTYLNTYELVAQPGDPVMDLAGFRNRTNIGSPTPPWRGNSSIFTAFGPHNLSFTARYIGDFINDDPSSAGEVIDGWLTFDAQYRLDLAGLGLSPGGAEPNITVGATNLFNEDPPFAGTSNAFAFASRVHDPRGRTFYARMSVNF